MWNPLIRALDSAPAEAGSIEAIAALMQRLTPDALAVACDEGRAMPWGRYLVHADPRGRFNLQLDVFSPGYRGQVHAHGTWGVFWVLQGVLVVSDHELVGTVARVQRVARITAGGGQCFCPPGSDWHRVATPESGPQSVSLHLYGPGFDLDTGVYLGEDGPAAYRRGPLGELASVAGSLRERAG